MAVKSAGDRQTQLKTGIIDDLQPFRIFYANLVAANAKIINPQSRVRDAFASTPRERFVGAGPWQVYTASGYIETPTDDPRLLYQDVLIALKTESRINNGQPTLHGLCMEALQVKPGESIVHVGAGTGYYTALLAHLTGAEGEVFAYEIDSDLAQRAAANLAGISNVTVYPRSGVEGPLPACDVVYVSAGATQPLAAWLEALRPGGRLLFPLTSGQSGAMLLITQAEGRYAARFLCQAMFIPCIGAREEFTEEKLVEAFRRGNWAEVRWLVRNASPDSTCWCAGRDWWLSTAP